MAIERALVVRKPWIDLILNGQKSWEMRSRSTSVRGQIGLIEQGSGLIVGECCLDGVGESIKNFNIGYGYQLHKIGDLELLDKWHVPWVLSGARRYEKPVPYKHPKGAVVWVRV
ncbi:MULTISPECIES: ASCH domain-containing protein [unclassified Neptuniibacter]|uniref:ASCH domain-containing protein n=1 Tax=unclassified Neptuniibacter TaxID=2630693 RepID=UPI000C5EE698|nr:MULTISPECIES: ASCH domain-containing protein [unclassified Neptuniibacter]MAY42401.1 hypothetical protein [Oceanospirillaceae bacterium]|tara:strand:- start:25307 stop:25648 length:342 start_codon:yes stop_codon:yes gene_type:complete